MSGDVSPFFLACGNDGEAIVDVGFLPAKTTRCSFDGPERWEAYQKINYSNMSLLLKLYCEML